MKKTLWSLLFVVYIVVMLVLGVIVCLVYAPIWLFRRKNEYDT
jgi:hypothetical protein